MYISVLIPTYRRPAMLRQAVASLFAGTRCPDEVVIVVRRSDVETVQLIAELQAQLDYGSRITSTWVTVPGHMPPIEAGAHTASGEIVAIIDDDVTVTPTWLEHMLSNFDDSTVGVVGGPVIVPGVDPSQSSVRPGQLSWFGEISGNFNTAHRQLATPIPVVTVMEGNSIWRRALLQSLHFDQVLNVYSAPLFGLDLTFQVREKGFQALFEPRALVYHHVAPRPLELDRANQLRQVFSHCRNSTYIKLTYFSWLRRLIFLVWWFLIGGKAGRGPMKLPIELVRYGSRRLPEYAVALAGKVEGIRLWMCYRCNNTL